MEKYGDIYIYTFHTIIIMKYHYYYYYNNYYGYDYYYYYCAAIIPTFLWDWPGNSFVMCRQ